MVLLQTCNQIVKSIEIDQAHKCFLRQRVKKRDCQFPGSPDEMSNKIFQRYLIRPH